MDAHGDMYEEIEYLKDQLLKAKKYILNLQPYCNNCESDMVDEDQCEGCNRKAFNWSHREFDLDEDF